MIHKSTHRSIHDILQVRGVINLCDEYAGPVKKYKTLGIQQLHLKTVDHFEPSVKDLKVCRKQKVLVCEL